MDMLKAFDRTIEMWEMFDYDPDTTIDPSLQLPHVKDMRGRITDDFSEAKLGRWLGWAQAAALANGIGSLDTFKTINQNAQ